MEESTVTIQGKGQDLVSGTVCVIVQLSTFGNRRKVNNSNVEVDADKEFIKVSKTLLDSDELKAVGKINQAIRQYVFAMCLPYVAGVHLLPMALVPQVDKKLAEFKERRADAVAKFIESYPKLCEKASENLRALYNATDYPSANALALRFGFEWQYVGFGPPGSLKKVSAEIFKNEQEKASRLMAEAAEEIQVAMRTALADLVDRLRDSLEPNADGKPKRLHKAAVNKLQEFLTAFEIKNVLGDEELKAEVERLRAIMNGVDAQSIRDGEGLRDSLNASMKTVSERLETMVEAGPRRKIRVEEEEAEAVNTPDEESVPVEF